MLFVLELEHSLAVERAEYEELTGKYELLEEEHVVTKARLTLEKEAAQGYVYLTVSFHANIHIWLAK